MARKRKRERQRGYAKRAMGKSTSARSSRAGGRPSTRDAKKTPVRSPHKRASADKRSTRPTKSRSAARDETRETNKRKSKKKPSRAPRGVERRSGAKASAKAPRSKVRRAARSLKPKPKKPTPKPKPKKSPPRKKRRAKIGAQPKRPTRRKAQRSKRAASLAAKKAAKTRAKKKRAAAKVRASKVPNAKTLGALTRLPSPALWPSTRETRSRFAPLLPSAGNELVDVSAIVGLNQTIASDYPKSAPTREAWRSDRFYLGKMRVFDALALDPADVLARYDAAIGAKRGAGVRVLGLVKRKEAKS